MQNQSSVVVKNDALESHGRAGRVVCAYPYKDDKGVDVVDVQLDGDGPEDLTVFPVVDLTVL